MALGETELAPLQAPTPAPEAAHVPAPTLAPEAALVPAPSPAPFQVCTTALGLQI
jgi:hypothetical protein